MLWIINLGLVSPHRADINIVALTIVDPEVKGRFGNLEDESGNREYEYAQENTTI